MAWVRVADHNLGVSDLPTHFVEEPDNYIRALVCLFLMVPWLPVLFAAAAVRSEHERRNGKLDVTNGSGRLFITVRTFRHLRHQVRISLVAAKTNITQGLLSMLAPLYAIALVAGWLAFTAYFRI